MVSATLEGHRASGAWEERWGRVERSRRREDGRGCEQAGLWGRPPIPAPGPAHPAGHPEWGRRCCPDSIHWDAGANVGPRAGDSDSRALLPRPSLVLRHLELLDEFARENIDSLYKVNFSKGRDALSTAVPRREPRFHLDREIRLQRLSHSGSRGRVGFRLVSVPARACGHQGLKWGAGPGLLLATELTLPPLPQCNSTGGDCFYRSYASGVVAVQDWYRFHYVDILALLPAAWEDSHGRQDGHFVLSCSYDGMDCQAR